VIQIEIASENKAEPTSPVVLRNSKDNESESEMEEDYESSDDSATLPESPDTQANITVQEE
jgi:hypothetical protein